MSVGGELRLPDEEKCSVPAPGEGQIFIGNPSSEGFRQMGKGVPSLGPGSHRPQLMNHGASPNRRWKMASLCGTRRKDGTLFIWHQSLSVHFPLVPGYLGALAPTQLCRWTGGHLLGWSTKG